MKNRIIYIFLLILLIAIFLPTFSVFAENTENKTPASSESAVTIASLKALIGQLQQQIKDLQDELAKLKTEMEEVKEELKLTKNLYKGLSDGEVKELQKFLSRFGKVYPEGLITGYFGPMTEKAVKKFQEQYEIPTTGLVGPLTRGKINEILTEEAKEEKVTICHIPPDNPMAKHTITVAQSAIEAHLANGDTAGACESQLTTAPQASEKKESTISTPVGSVVQIASGIRNLCVLATDGLVYCQNQNTWLKKDFPGWNTGNTFTVVPGLTEVASIAMGEYFACAVKKDSSVFCWGTNEYGQLGDGTFIGKMEPVQVSGLGPGTTASVSLGSIHACALKNDSSVVCWGSNDSLWGGGQLGDGTKEWMRSKPIHVVGLESGSTSALFSYYFGTCAIKIDNSIFCWGAVHANDYSATNKPTRISQNLGIVKSLSLGSKSTCALKNDGSVVCWGTNYCGQLGNNTNTSTETPTQVIGLGPGSTAAIDNAGGGYFRSALKTDGSVVSWGCGAPGNGTRINKYSPIQVSGLGAGTTAAISDLAPCALKIDSSVVCWYEPQPYDHLSRSVPGLK